MTITLLPTPRLSRRYAAGYMDSLGRFITMEVVYVNSPSGFDLTHGTAPERYDPSTGAWTLLAEDDAAYQDFGTAAIDAGDKIYRAGGQNLSNLNNYTPTFHVFDSAANSWSAVGPFPSAFGGRIEAAVFVDPSRGVFAGGGLAQQSDTEYRDWYLLSGGALVARATPPQSISWRGPPMVDAAGRVYFCGTANTPSGSFFRYDPSTDAWFTTAATTITTSGFNSCIDQANGIIYTATISVGNLLLRRYDIAANTWTSRAGIFGLGLSSPGFVTFLVFHPPSQSVYLYGIFSNSGGDPNVYKYEPVADIWSTTGDRVATPVGSILYPPPFDGVGYYVGQRSDASNNAINVVEYWVPATLPTMGVGLGLDTTTTLGARSFATIIGA